MSVNEDWDVEQHKVEYESDEHWELRRNFLLAHKDKFSEDTLVCLAQVFVNVELLGCRYPQETMDLVEELSQDIAAKYREKQKKKLQRTFVEASEAASSKVKGYVARTSIVTEEQVNTPNNVAPNTIKNEEQFLKKSNTKKRSVSTIKKSKLNTTNCNYESCEKSNIEESLSKRLKTEENMLRDNPYGDITLWERPGDIPQSTLGNSASISGVNLEWRYSTIQGIWECSIYINSKKVSCCSNSNKKTAKNEAAAAALDELRKHYYTIKVKQNLDSKSNVTVTTKEMKPQERTPDNDWKASSCIGEELMRRMGWTGGGLGKSEQGVVEPMSTMVKSQISRKGLGLKSSSCTANEMRAKCRNLFKNFLQTSMQNDIVFLDFTSEERSVIHQIARTMGLKSRSYGTTDQRKLIISRKIDVRTLVKELKSLGGVTEKYELIGPIDKKFTSTSTGN
ncbi:NF-kappa-B-repressing factor [Anoplolepis gracilipes]|uniref:NF-kappa-B-repressing factor n=1 Tax=Anoplolepis gracilipes TaxID=354296 RepID=UPI003B9E241C